MKKLCPKFVASLTFRGFTMAPTEVEALVGAPATLLGSEGTGRHAGSSPLVRSFAQWSLDFDDSARLDELLPKLMSITGDVDHLLSVRKKVNPEYLEFDIATWKAADEYIGGGIDAETIAMMAKLSATLGFGVYSRDDFEPGVPADGFAAAELNRCASART